MAAPSRTDKLFAELNSAMDTSSSSAAQPFVFTAGGTNSMPPPPVPTVQKTRKYLCMQRPVFDVEREFDPEELEEDEMKAFMAKRKKDAKKYSEKPLSDHPGHTWVISELGMWFREKYFVEAQMRDQDKFGMHIYNDYTGYGMQEVIQNILQSFADEFSKPGNGSPYTLWAHIEALNWLLCEDGIDNMSWNMLDDGERVSNTLFGMGMAVLATLNILEQHSLLKADSSIPNIPVTLSLVFQWISTFTDAMDNDLATQCDWPNMIVAYAEKNGIEIKGLYNVDEILEEYGTEDMKKADKKKVTDPPKADKFSFVTKFKGFARLYGKKGKIGGKQFDLRTLSKAERIKASYDGTGKDPLKGVDVPKLGPMPV